MKQLFGIFLLLVLLASCSDDQTARLHFVTGSKEPIVISTDWVGYQAGDSIMLARPDHGSRFFLERNYGGSLEDWISSDTHYRVAVIDEIFD